ncbi:MAG: flavin monoamine oxidase family protein, partial [Candidatus Binataceae bacterium]
VGGGVSGLSAAYFLRNYNFLLLEKEPHWGGNAYREEYQGQGFATGSAFSERNSPGDHLARELGLTLLPVNCADPTIVNGKWVKDTWGTGLDELPFSASVRESFKKFKADMLAIDYEKNPVAWDNQTLGHILRNYAPEIKQWWDAYGPSNWGAKADDTSALVAISDMHSTAGEDKDDERVTLPGGNGAISRRLAETLQAKYADHMAGDATIIGVDPQKEEVNVTFVHGGKLDTVAAKYVVMATPKFITGRIVSGLPNAQSDAMMSFRMCPYPVINMIFDKAVYNKAYDTWCPGNTFTDFIVADWVMQSQPGYKQKNNILTFYTPLTESRRSRLLEISSCKTIAANALADFQKLLPEFKDAEPVEIHFYRRGHPMFMATPGTFTKTIPAANQPLERVAFANTDSVGPVSDVGGAIVAARRAADFVEKRMAGKSASTAKRAAGFAV